MNSIVSDNLKRVMYNISEAKAKYRSASDIVRLMAVTKTVPYQLVNEVVEQGVTLLGENRVQEYLEKKDFYDKSAEINFIGHLQSNKIKYIINSVSCIYSVDSISLAKEIDRYSQKNNRIMNILAEVNIGEEESKSGVSPEKLEELIYSVSELKNIRIKGLMSIPPVGDSEIFLDKMHGLFQEMKSKNIENVSMDILSTGMSSDYVNAIKHGSNVVRIGSGIFGARK